MIKAMAGAVVLAVIGILGFAPFSQAQQTYDINVILPLSGPAAFVGQSSQKALGVLEKLVNAEGGINGNPVKFVILDDQTNPQVAVQLTSSILPNRPVLLLGSAISAECSAMAPLMSNGPVMYCFSPAIKPAPGGYVFSATVASPGLVGTLMRYFKARGWTRLAMLSATDASGRDGEDALDQVLKEPDLKDIKMVERVAFNTSDVTISAQVERVLAAKPQAVLLWATGTAMGTALKGFQQAGADLPTGSTTANMTYAFMRQYASILPKDLFFAANEGTAQGEGLKLDPRTEAAKKKYYAAFQAIGVQPDTGTEIVWDATMISVAALRNSGPTPTPQTVRDYIAHLKEYAGISGVYDFEKAPQRGLDEHSPAVVRWTPEKSRFVAVSQPGGEPIAPN